MNKNLYQRETKCNKKKEATRTSDKHFHLPQYALPPVLFLNARARARSVSHCCATANRVISSQMEPTEMIVNDCNAQRSINSRANNEYQLYRNENVSCCPLADASCWYLRVAQCSLKQLTVLYREKCNEKQRNVQTK